MNCWWFLVHSYCWTCGFQGPFGAQGAVGCPLETTQVNHYCVDVWRGFVRHGFVRRGFWPGLDFWCGCLGGDFGVDLFSMPKRSNHCGRMH